MSIVNVLMQGVRPLVERFPRAAMTYRHFRDLRDVMRTPVMTPFGFSFVGNETMEAGDFEPVETDFVRRALQDADVLVNVGANIGYYCCLALRQRRKVIAFEPMSGNLRYLYRNIHANDGDDAVEVHPVALGERAGLAEIYGGGTMASLVRGWSGMSANYKETVPVSTLDDSLGHRLPGSRLLIVVDIEGAELAMLRGASCVLARKPKPVWMVEISIDEHQPAGLSINPHLAETFELFRSAGYVAWELGATFRPLQDDRIHRIVSSGVNTLETHNFVFVEPGHAITRVAQGVHAPSELR